ncbi:MAG: TIGR04211 family SH3 domain-containing protein [Ectothiorhodospiraceae bacterium]|nr:TIGR04211 family SH3 domain-containing protein [Chromatiales bacterium]MCP5154777.1 TIGR04211 family SH3 domain-containing protein [Ectothiorhodospiraceae bacterium]
MKESSACHARPRRLPALLWVAALGATLPVLADQMWVTDRLQLGLHEDASLRSRVIELLPSGTPLTVLAREGALAQVRTEHGTVGWVGDAYLSEEEPARARLTRLEAEHEQLLHEGERLRQLGAELEGALAEAQARAVEAEARAAPQRADDVTAREAVPAEPDHPATTTDEASPDAEPREYLARVARGLERALARPGWEWGALAVSTLVGVGVGAWLVDWRSRRRHGGFRV